MIPKTKSLENRIKLYKKITLVLVALTLAFIIFFFVFYMMNNEKCSAADSNYISPVEITQTAITKEVACRNAKAACVRLSLVPSQCKVKD